MGGGHEQVDGIGSIQARSQQALLLQTFDQAFHDACSSRFQSVNHWQGIDLGAGKAHKVAHQRWIDGPDATSDRRDLGEGRDRVGMLDCGKQVVEMGTRQEIGGDGVDQAGRGREVAIEGRARDTSRGCDLDQPDWLCGGAEQLGSAVDEQLTRTRSCVGAHSHDVRPPFRTAVLHTLTVHHVLLISACTEGEALLSGIVLEQERGVHHDLVRLHGSYQPSP